MMHIRLIAAAATAIGVAFALSPASARSCGDGDATCPSVAQETAPMQLDNFMKTWKPVAVSKHKGKSRSARRRAAQEAVAEAKSKAAAAKADVAEAKPEPTVMETAPPAEPASPLAADAGKTIETDGVGVASFEQPNELDAAADRIPVVAFNDVNEIDLEAPPPAPVPAETVGQSIASEPMPADRSWIAKLLLAAAGSIAIAGATRFLVVA
jgi:hypothetical protein